MPEALDVNAALKGLRLYGMAAAWADLSAQGGPAAVDSGRWLIEHLLQVEATDRFDALSTELAPCVRQRRSSRWKSNAVPTPSSR